MDVEQKNFQVLGFFGIFKEAFNITTSQRKIFSQITLSFILPLSFIYLVQNEFSEYFFGKITPDKFVMDDPQMGSQENSMTTSNMFSSGGTTFWLFRIAFFISSIIFSLFSTSAVVYTVACIYTAKEVTYKKILKVVPKVWKRLMITFLWNFIILIGSIVVAALVIIIICFGIATLGSTATVIAISIAIIISVIYLVGLVYLCFVWQLANVISVLEDAYGIQAMLKSKDLIKGNIRVYAAVFFIYNMCFLVVDLGFKASAAGVDSVWVKILHACLWSLIRSMSILFVLVIQTIIYFICKSYHHEDTDKSSLASHLEVYHDDYVPLDTKDVDVQHSLV